MSDNTQGSDFDLTQFYAIFYEEAGENLEAMEQKLLELDIETVDDEELNAIFRCAHSIKGGAATFGFDDVAELTHQMESLLDKLRRHELNPTKEMVDILLESTDALKALLAKRQGLTDTVPDTAGLVSEIKLLTSTPKGTQSEPIKQTEETQKPQPPETTPAVTAPADGERQIVVTFSAAVSEDNVAGIKGLFSDIDGLGVVVHSTSSPLSLTVNTTSKDEDLLDLFAFHANKDDISITQANSKPEASPSKYEGVAYGLFENAPGMPSAASSITETAPASVQPSSAPTPAAQASKPEKASKPAAQSDNATLRVSINKIDQLINQVGELVITQAMLAQNSRGLDAALHQQLMAGLADLERNTRDLQESVMSIRMIPMSVVFSRFPRMLRDLATKLGKKVDLITQGEATELDKGLIEKITDPLTHLIRNSCDHGIEMPQARAQAGKPENGTITLSASHQGGSILIEVRDDGKGLSRKKLIEKAQSKGIEASDDMSDSEVWNLIFAPGFSTAEVVTDVSGRGVGMDVVKKNITSLGGTVEIDSIEGQGMSVKVRLPLTLAIMDGMSVRVGRETYILPLASVIEAFQVKDSEITTIAQTQRLVKVRENYMPVLALDAILSVPRDQDSSSNNAIMVVIEDDGTKAALLVDELVGQQQVVIKNLEANYKKVPNVSGATILGDGSVSLILDTSSLVRKAD